MSGAEDEEIDSADDSNFFEIEHGTDPSIFNIDTAFGATNNDFLYIIKFSEDPDTREYSFVLTLCYLESDDDDDEEEQDAHNDIFTWKDLSLDYRPLFLNLIQLFISLPELFAFRYRDCVMSSDALVWSVEESHRFLAILEQARQLNLSDSIILTISLLNQEYISVLRSFENLTITQFEIKQFFQKCQLVYDASQVYEKFGVGELVNLSRHHCFSANFILHLYRVVTQFNANDQSLNSKFLNILTD
jgi:hypothetical protein